MPNSNVQFQGQTIPIPGAYFADNVLGTIPTNPSLTPPMVFIAYGYGGKPFTPQHFPNGGGQALYNALRGAPSADYVQFIANPSTSLFGASEVVYINCSENTQSSLTLQTAGAVNIVSLTSTDYGPPSNLLQCAVQNGTVAGNSVTLFDGYSGTTQSSVDNLGVPFQIAYTGAASGVTMTINAVSGTAYANAGGGTTISTGAGATQMVLSSPNSGESITLSLGFGQYSTVGQLVAYINTTGYYVAQVVPNVVNGQLPTAMLSSVSSVSLPKPVSTVNQFVNVNARPGSIIYWVNQFASNLAAASGVIGTTSQVPAVIPLTHFSGATAVPPVLGDYTSAFTAAAGVAAWTVFADSSDPGVRALGAQHAFLMGEPQNGKWRRFITGSVLGDTVSQTQTNARTLNTKEATYCYPGIWRTDAFTGQNVLFDGLHVAAAVASIMAGNQIAQPLTLQSLVGNGVEVQLTTGAGGQIDELQQFGVMVVYQSPTTGQPTIVSDFTTWNNDNNPENVFNQQIACRQALGYSLSQGLQSLVGGIASPYGITRIRNAVTSILNQLIYSPGNNGFVSSWDPKSLKIVYNGSTQSANLTVNVTFVGQFRYIFELAFVQPLNLAA